MPKEHFTMQVVSLFKSEGQGILTPSIDTVHLSPSHGLVGDSHMRRREVEGVGAVVPHRHFTAVHVGELGRIANGMGVPFIDPAWIKANICFSCPELDDFTETLVPGTKIIDEQGRAVLEVKGMTAPCLPGGEYIASQLAAYGSHLAVAANRFPKAAYKLRGVHGIALAEITLHLNDILTALLPE